MCQGTVSMSRELHSNVLNPNRNEDMPLLLYRNMLIQADAQAILAGLHSPVPFSLRSFSL